VTGWERPSLVVGLLHLFPEPGHALSGSLSAMGELPDENPGMSPKTRQISDQGRSKAGEG